MHSLATLAYFQLKYCERCGGLWLRPDGTATPYCPACERIMAALPLRARPATRNTHQGAGGAIESPAQPGSVCVV